MVKDGEGPFLSRCKGVEYLSGLSRLRALLVDLSSRSDSAPGGEVELFGWDETRQWRRCVDHRCLACYSRD